MRALTQLFNIIIIVSVIFTLHSCDSSRHVPYFKDLTDTLAVSAEIAEKQYTEPLIVSHDILQITVQTIDLKSGDIFLQFGRTIGDASNTLAGYEVDNEGYIELPIIGRLHVEGLTLFQARDLIREKASVFYKDPAVNIRYANFYITILGEVTHQGKFFIPNEKVNILDAMGLCGDLLLTAQRDKVLLIREENGKKLFIRLNLNSSKIFQSPYYYLKSGDVLYVEPLKFKQRAATTDTSRDRYISLVSSVLSLIFSAVTLITLAKK